MTNTKSLQSKIPCWNIQCGISDTNTNIKFTSITRRHTNAYNKHNAFSVSHTKTHKCIQTDTVHIHVHIHDLFTRTFTSSHWHCSTEVVLHCQTAVACLIITLIASVFNFFWGTLARGFDSKPIFPHFVAWAQILHCLSRRDNGTAAILLVSWVTMHR